MGHTNTIDLATQLVARCIPIVLGLPITIALFFRKVQEKVYVFEVLLCIFISTFIVVTNAKFGAQILVNTGGVIYPDAPISISVIIFSIIPSRSYISLVFLGVHTISMIPVVLGYGIPVIVSNLGTQLATDTIVTMVLAIPLLLAVDIVCVSQFIITERYFRNTFKLKKVPHITCLS
jgi:hypothetical protein